ncbi:hypothetical protein ACFWU5_23090 [Nocardia sp. NPDC058640]|uniref:hypothetical protein n=1 Tax=Nocardia sp. NPDC058640 TaxID=3346571 RepID=UPI0036520253
MEEAPSTDVQIIRHVSDPISPQGDSSPMTPRISQVPYSVIDVFDRQLTRATNAETHSYYTNLLDYSLSTLKVARSTVVMLVLAAGAAFVVFAAGIAAAVYLAGMPLHMAVGVGVLSGSASTVLGAITLGRYAVMALGRIKSLTAGNEKTAPHEPANPPTAGESASHASAGESTS